MAWEVNDVQKYLKTYLRITAVDTVTEESVTVEVFDTATVEEVKEKLKSEIASLKEVKSDKDALLAKFKAIDLSKLEVGK